MDNGSLTANPTPPKRRVRRSIGTSLFAIALIASTLLASTVAYAFVWNTRHARADARTDANYQATLSAEAIHESLVEAQASLGGLAQSPAMIGGLRNPENCTLTASGLGTFPDGHLDLVLLDGTVVCTSLVTAGAPAGATHADAPWFADALQAEAPVVAPVSEDALTGERAVVIAAPLLENGETVGVIAGVFDVAGVANTLAGTYAGPDGFSFTVVEDVAGLIGSASGLQEQVGAVVRDTEFSGRQSGTWQGLDGTEQVFGSATVPELDWRIYAGLPSSAVTATARESLERQAVLVLIAGLALAALTFFMNRRIVRPVRDVTKAMVNARAKPLPAPVPVDGPAEVAALASEFNAMLEARLDYEARLTEFALHDNLTGLPNRALLHDRLEHALQRQLRDGTGVAVLFVDLNRFKIVNDSFGHPAGDALLRAVATRLSGTLRPSDTIARFGGDEFVVVCEDIDNDAEAIEVARRLEASLVESFVDPDGGSVVLSASIGIAVAPAAGRDADDLLREADIAMYQAKRTGRGWELCDEEIHIKAVRKLHLEQELRRTIERNETLVHYQPIFDVERDVITGLEALARWNHPVHGYISPDSFIPLAEETGQIIAVGEQLLRRSCDYVAGLNAAGSDLTLSVNVAVAQLNNDFPAIVEGILSESGLTPDRLCLEITESSLMRAFGAGGDTLARLRALGVQLAVDDFGTGYSSLSYLQRFQFDTLKIDRTFVEPLGARPQADALVTAIIGMAKALELNVVAEGVETRRQLDTLRALGCALIQGFLFAEPMPPEKVEQLFTDRLVLRASRG